jgi:hypothetical protein
MGLPSVSLLNAASNFVRTARVSQGAADIPVSVAAPPIVSSLLTAITNKERT